MASLLGMFANPDVVQKMSAISDALICRFCLGSTDLNSIDDCDEFSTETLDSLFASALNTHEQPRYICGTCQRWIGLIQRFQTMQDQAATRIRSFIYNGACWPMTIQVELPALHQVRSAGNPAKRLRQEEDNGSGDDEQMRSNDAPTHVSDWPEEEVIQFMASRETFYAPLADEPRDSDEEDDFMNEESDYDEVDEFDDTNDFFNIPSIESNAESQIEDKPPTTGEQIVERFEAHYSLETLLSFYNDELFGENEPEQDEVLDIEVEPEDEYPFEGEPEE